MAREASNRNTLRRIETTAGSLAKDYINLRVTPRGVPTFVDQRLSGTVRFAKRRGNLLPVIAADNSSEQAANVAPPTNALRLARVVPGKVIEDAVLTLGPGREFARIFDIDSTTGEVTTSNEIIGVHSEGEQVDLYGVPIAIIGNWAAGAVVIQVRSTYKMAIGDHIAIETTAGLLNSLVSTLATHVAYLGTTIDGRYNYEVTLSVGVARSLVNEEGLLLRAQPGYESMSLSVSRLTGPFVLDYISGVFYEDTKVDESLSVQLVNPVGLTLPGFDQPVAVGKNHAITNMPIKAESMLFWNVVEGSIQWNGDRFVAITDENGLFTLSQELVPEFSPGTEWEIPLRSDDVALVRIAFLPNDYRTLNLSAGIVARLTVGMESSDLPAQRIEIAIRSESPGAHIEFFDWLPTEYTLSTIMYQISATAFGDNIWQAGSLMLKPYFFTLEDVRARYDFSAYDRGTIHL